MSSATPQRDVSYPIVYNVVTWVRVLMVIIALVFGSGWIYISLRPPYAHGETVFNPVLLGIGALVIAGLAYGVAWAFTARIVLYADRFEQHKPFVHRVLRINDIAGRRYTTGRGSGYPIIVPATGQPFSVDMSAYGLDERFNQWFLQLTDLQQLERDKELERIRNDTTLGATPGDRINANASRRQNFIVAGVLLALASVSLFFISMENRDRFAALFVANAILPWATLLLAVFYKDQVIGPDGGNFVFLPVAIMVPVLSLGMIAAESARVTHPMGIFVWGLLIGVALVAAMRFLIAALSKSGLKYRESTILMLVFLPFAWVYAGGTLALANRTMDMAAPQIIPAKVLGKYVQRGKSSRHYYLRVVGPAALMESESIRVEPKEYSQVSKGDVVCVAMHPGRLGFPWMETMNCSGQQDGG